MKCFKDTAPSNSGQKEWRSKRESCIIFYKWKVNFPFIKNLEEMREMEKPVTTILEGVPLSELCTIAEAAKALGVAYITAYGFIGRKRLPWRWATAQEESQLNSEARIGSLPGKQPGGRLKLLRLVDIQQAKADRRERGKRGKDKGNRIRRTKSEMAPGRC